MKISPMASPAATVGVLPSGGGGEPQGMRARALRMTTNATPGFDRPPADAQAPGDPSIPDANTDANAAPEDTQPLSPQLALLRKHQRALQLERQAFEREKAEAQARTGAAGDGLTLAQLKTDPLGFIRKAGLTYDDLVDFVVKDGEGGNAAALDAKIESLKSDFDTKLTERDKQQEQAALAAMSREADAIVTAAPDQFEMVKATGSVSKAIELIERVYRKDGSVMDVREALQLVEDELFADVQQRLSLKKVQQALAPQPAPTQQRQNTMRTLTNRDTASAPMSAKQRAIAAFQGTPLK